VKRTSKIFLVLLLGAALPASAQCPTTDGKVIGPPRNYPMISDRYAVQYQVGGGPLTTATVHISYYGETTASPYRNDSGYTAGSTSMSFVSIPVSASAAVQLRVTKLFGNPFQARDGVSVRPRNKVRDVSTGSDGTVLISTSTASAFAGDQFILWWNRGADGGGVEGLAFFLDPPYTRPTGSKVKVVNTPADLTGDLSAFDTLDFETTLAIGSTGAVSFDVPLNILNIFLGPNAWVQGKLRFPTGNATRKIYGPGVLDGSRFNYLNRNCTGDDGIYSLSSDGANGVLNHFVIDGIVISDHNHAANDIFYNGTLNNVKTISWNGENAALRLGDSTTASNIFVRSGDDSLMIWGASVTVTNATVWQNYNGGVVNLGWLNNSVGDGVTLDGLYVVKTDWLIPTSPSWNAISPPGPPSSLNGQNNAVFASLMTPTTEYGTMTPAVFRNILVEDPPNVLFSLKIVPPINCSSTCPASTYKQPSSVNLKIENLFTPASIVENSIGFQTLPAGYTAWDGTVFPSAYTLTGTMNIALSNVVVRLSNDFALTLTKFDAGTSGKIATNGSGINLQYSSELPPFRK
jgi:hypothetical protein